MTNTPYDDVFRTLLTDCTELILPVVNEIFHMNYTGKSIEDTAALTNLSKKIVTELAQSMNS